ncbi:MAG: TRAP transporter small permease [Pseudomonadota bacterium]
MKKLTDIMGLFPTNIAQITKLAVILCCVAITVDIILGVFFRYVLNRSLQWSEEAGVYAMIWMVFLGSALLMRNSEHISITALVRRLPLQVKVGITLFSHVIGTIFLILVAYYGIKVFNSPVHAFSHSCGFSTKWVKFAIPVGSILMLVESIHLLVVELSHLLKGNTNHFN